MHLTPSESQAIAARVKAFEAEVGVEVVTLVVGKADTYPETVWKAFALGAAIAALAVAAGDLMRPDWVTSAAALWASLAILGAGAVAATACVYVPAVTRLFLRETRASLEVSQYAKVQFLERGLTATANRTAVLVMVSLLERRVVVLADRGLDGRVSAAEWDAVIAAMTGLLRTRRVGDAVQAGLDGIAALLRGKGIARGAGNAFGDAPIEREEP